MAKRSLNSPGKQATVVNPHRSTWVRFATLGGIVLLVAITCAAYWPALYGGFLVDDDELLTNSRLVRSPNGLQKFWFTTEAADYWPLTNTSFWLEWRLWWSDPTGYHVTNLVLHIAAALLIWAILRRMAIPGAFLAALLFAVHPVNVESVAWISQRKNTLAMVFFLLSILWYVRAEQGRASGGAQRERPETIGEHPKRKKAEQVKHLEAGFGGWYWLSLAAFVLAMLSKGSVAILPLLLLLLVWWQKRRVSLGDFARTVPFFLVAAVLTLVNLWFQKHGNNVVIRDATFAERLAGSGSVVWFYLSKALAPIELLFVYRSWQINAYQLLWWLPLLAAAAVTALLWRRRGDRPGRALLFAWAMFCISLAPVLGFTDVGFMRYSLVADHYEHIALIGAVALVAACLSVCQSTERRIAGRGAQTVAVILVATLAVLTFKQSWLYGHPIALYEETLAKNPECWLIHDNLGISLLSEGRKEEAAEHFSKALQIRPDYGVAHHNLGIALAHQGKIAEAIDQFKQTILLEPDYPQAQGNWGAALIQSGKLQEAEPHLLAALKLQPDYPEALNDLGLVLMTSGRMQEAIGRYRQALEIKPDYANAHNNLGFALLNSGNAQEALEHFQAAVRIKPKFAEAQVNAGVALAQQNKFQQAAEQFQQALQVQPENAKAYANLSKAYAALRRQSDALAAAQKAFDLAKAQGQKAMAAQIKVWLDSIRSGQSDPSQQTAPPESK